MTDIKNPAGINLVQLIWAINAATYMWDLGKHEQKKYDVIINYPARWGPYDFNLWNEIQNLHEQICPFASKDMQKQCIGWSYTFVRIYLQ